MSAKTILIIAYVVVAGICGLTHTILNIDMIDAINRNRPADDQLTDGLYSWADFKRSAKSDFWSVQREFRRLFPNRRTYLWHRVTLVVPIAFTLIVMAALALGIL